ncbi:hypothetical protein [Streptomyces sp. NPDC055134]
MGLLEAAPADQGAAQRDEGFMEFEASFSRLLKKAQERSAASESGRS